MPDTPRERLSIDDATLAKLRPILELVRTMGRGPDLRKILAQVLEAALAATRAETGILVTFRKDRAKIHLSRDREGRKIPREKRGLSPDALAEVLRNGRRHHRDGTLYIPVRGADRTVGALCLGSSLPFGARDAEVAEILAGHLALALENAKLYKASHQDRLTRLWNHAHFLERLGREIERGPCGVLMIDVDDFKQVNDRHGHETGNAVLKHVARTITETLRGADVIARKATVARFGGDEFEVILPGADRDGARIAAARLVVALGDRKLRYETHALRLSISVGGAVYPADASRPEDLLARADEALYVSKRAGKNRAAMAGDPEKRPPAAGFRQ
jgi:diguanylate cyclase (GGDEF)-like protein